MKQRRIVLVAGSINVWQWREITNLSSPLSPSGEGPVEVNQELSSVLVGCCDWLCLAVLLLVGEGSGSVCR